MKSIMIIKNILYILLGIYFIISPIFFKVILIRLPRDIQDIPVFLIVLSLSIYLYLIYKLIINVYFTNKESYLNSFIKTHFVNPLQELYYTSIKKIDDYIKHTLLGPKYIGENLLKLSIFLNRRLTENKCKIILAFFDIVPRVAFILLFFIDVVIFHQLNNIYYFGLLTLIPILYRYLIYTFKGFALANIKDLLECLSFLDENYEEVPLEIVLDHHVTHSYNLHSLDIPIIKNITVKEPVSDKQDFEETLTFYLDQFHVFTKSYNYIDFFEHLKKQKYYQIFLLITYFCYFIIWLYIVNYIFEIL